MTNRASFHVVISHLCIFCEVLFKSFIIFIGVFLLLFIEFQDFFIYSGYIFFIRYVICSIYNSLVPGLSFHSLNNIFQMVILNFKSNLSVTSMDHTYGVISKKSLTNTRSHRFFFSYSFSGNFMVLCFIFRSRVF